jgi:oligosaccharide repeat unit polymerase
VPSAANIVFGATLAVCLAVVVRTSTAPGFRFSPALLFVAIFILQQAFGCIGLVQEGDPAGSRARIGLGLGIAGVALGTWAANAWARFDPRELSGVRARFELRSPHRALELRVVLAGYAVAVVFLAFYFHNSGGIPLLQGIGAFLSGDEVRLAQQLLKEKRMEMTYFEASSYRGQGYVDQIRMVALPYCVACLVLWAGATGRRRFMLLAAVAAMPAVLFLMGTGQRHPVAAFLLALTILGYTVMPARVHGKLLGWFGGVGFVVFFAMTYLLGRYTHTDDFGQDLLMVFQGIWNRIVYSNAYGTLALFDMFPNPEPFRWGSTWLNDLQGFLPGPYVAFSSWLYRRLYGAVGTAAPMCFGEMYANFGLLGVLVGGACVGVFLQMLQVAWARRSRYGVEHIVVYALGSMAFMRWAMGGLLAPIQHGAVALPMLVVGVRAGREVLRGIDAAWRTSLERGGRFDAVRSPRAPVGLQPAFGRETSDP